MIKNIQGIKYDNNPYGEAFGGGIYSASCSIGFANTPTKISLSVVSEDSNYDISDSDMDVTDTGAHTITIGGSVDHAGNPVNNPDGTPTAMEFKRMYIYSYSKNDTPGSKTLTVNFVDHSICLDKIFVGLIGRHGTRTTVNTGEGPAYNPANDSQVTAISQTWNFRLICEECNELRPSKVLRPPSWKPAYPITRQTYIAGDGQACPQPLRTYINVNQGLESVNGGYLLLGSEEFKDTECEIPKVSYTFEDLCNAIDWLLGGDPMNCNGTNDPDKMYRHNLRDFERSKTYTGTYTGTLREVLSAWAADFSFDFTFNHESDEPEIVAIDLKNPVDLINIKNAINTGFGPNSAGGLVRTKRELHTLENTYYQKPLVKYIKPPRPFQRTKQVYDPKLGKVLTVIDAIGRSAHLGRSDDELYVSMALAKYTEESRLIWLSDLARSKSEDKHWCNPNHTAGQLDINNLAGSGNGGCGPAAPVIKDPKYDGTVHGSCDDPNYGTKFDCESMGQNWTPSADDYRLRKDTPWPALGFFPAISFNNFLDKSLGHMNAANGILGNGGAGAGGSLYRGAGERMRNLTAAEKNKFDPSFLVDGTGKSCVSNPAACEKLKEIYVDPSGYLLSLIDAHPAGKNPSATQTRCDQVVGSGTQAIPEGNCYHYHKDNRRAAQDLLARHEIAGLYGISEEGAHPVYGDPEKFSVYLGIWNEAYQDKVGDFDKELANGFLGKYGYWYGNRTNDVDVAAGIFNDGPVNPPPNARDCPKWVFDLEGGQQHATYLYQYKINTLPESKIYSGHSYPFANILRANGGFFAIPPGTVDTQPYCTYCPSRSVFEIEDNNWGTPPDSVSAMMRNKFIVETDANVSFTREPHVISDLNLYIPKYKRISPTKDRQRFINIVGMEAFEESILEPEHMKSGYFPGIAVIPHLDKMFVPIQENICVYPAGKKDGAGNDISGQPIPGCNATMETLCVNPVVPAGGQVAGCGGEWKEGVITRYDPVLKVDYSHWRCTAAQVQGGNDLDGGQGALDCWPDDLGAGAAYDCSKHWCHTGAGYCTGLDSDMNGAPDNPQPNTNDPYPSMSAKQRCQNAPAGYQGAWTAGAFGSVTPGGAQLGAGDASPGSLPISATYTDSFNGQPKKMFPTDQSDPAYVAGSKPSYCTTDPDDLAYNLNCWGTYREDSEVFNALVYSNFTRRENESLIGKASECVLYCEEDIKSEVCASECPEEDEPIHGFQSFASRYLEITHMTDRVKIVYPIEHIYTGFWYSDQLDKGTIMKKQVVMGEPPIPQELKDRNVMGTRIIDFDATPDLDALESTVAGNFQEQLVIHNTTLNPPQNEVVSLPQYYSFLLATSVSAEDPSEQIELKLDGTEFDTLAPLLTAENGLSSFNIALDGEGVSTSLSFRTRPKKLPKREVLLQKIGPQAITGRIPKPNKILGDYRATQANQRHGGGAGP
jgi:hypothetical protein